MRRPIHKISLFAIVVSKCLKASLKLFFRVRIFWGSKNPETLAPSCSRPPPKQLQTCFQYLSQRSVDHLKICKIKGSIVLENGVWWGGPFERSYPAFYVCVIQ